MTGQSIQKGLNRLAGAIAGAITGFVLLAFFIQDRWLFFTFLSLYMAISVYFSMGTARYNYFWQQAGFFAAVVGLDSAFNPVNAFSIAIERAQGSGTGLLVYTVLGLLLWPSNSQKNLEETGSQLTTELQALFRNRMARMRGQDDIEAEHTHRAQVVALRRRFDALLDAAEIDSWEVDETRHAWRRSQTHIAELAKALEQWQQNFNELKALDIEQLITDLPVFEAEMDARFSEIERMFAGHAPSRKPELCALQPNSQARDALSNFDQAALTVCLDRLLHLEKVSHHLFTSVSDIRDYGGAKTAAPKTRVIITLDRDRFDEALRVAVTAWLAFLAVIFIPDIPTGLAAISLITRLVIADTAFAWISIPRLIAPTLAGLLFGFLCYSFVMPMLPGFTGLAILLFAVVFSIDYFLNQPKLSLWRILLLFLFMSVADIKNRQTYEFMAFSDSAMQWVMLFLLLSITEYFPVRQQPDHVFLRMISRFFHSSEFLMQSLVLNPQSRPTYLARLRKTFHAYEVATLPGKLANWGKALPTAARGRTLAQQPERLTQSLQALAFRLQELLEARTAAQSESLVQALYTDIQAWRIAVQEIFAQLSRNPEAAANAALGTRLDALLARLETRIAEALNAAQRETVPEELRQNLYRLLGAHRGVSEALIDFAQQSGEIDWDCLREPRF